MQASPWEHDLALELLQVFQDRNPQLFHLPGAELRGMRPEAALPVFSYLKEKVGFEAIVDITAVDYPKREVASTWSTSL